MKVCITPGCYNAVAGGDVCYRCVPTLVKKPMSPPRALCKAASCLEPIVPGEDICRLCGRRQSTWRTEIAQSGYSEFTSYAGAWYLIRIDRLVDAIRKAGQEAPAPPSSP